MLTKKEKRELIGALKLRRRELWNEVYKIQKSPRFSIKYQNKQGLLDACGFDSIKILEIIDVAIKKQIAEVKRIIDKLEREL